MSTDDISNLRMGRTDLLTSRAVETALTAIDTSSSASAFLRHSSYTPGRGRPLDEDFRA